MKRSKKSAEFINLPNIIKGKVGSGGLSEAILAKAQQLLDEHQMDFTPAAQKYLDDLQAVIEVARSGEAGDFSDMVEKITIPCVELQSHGTMFHFDLVSTVSKRIIIFLQDITVLDDEVIEILNAYHSTIRAIVLSKIYGDGGKIGFELLQTLSDACDRYFERKS